MRINPELKAAIDAIAATSVKFHNEPTRHVRYIRRILKVYDNHFTEEERIYLFSTIIEALHYRNLSVDPENMITISNIRIRALFFVFVATIILMLLAAILFKTNSGVAGVIPVFMNFFKMFSL